MRRLLSTIAVLGALAVLPACASFSAGSDAPISQRVTAARTDLNTAGLFIALYAAMPECGAGVQQPCHNARVLDLLQKGQVVAKSALDAVDALIAAGATEEKVLVALQEAEKAVVTLQNLKANAGG